MVGPVRISETPRRVLIVKPSALGDVVTALPVLRGLRRTFPGARVSWLISDTCAPLLRHDSQLDELILFERRHLGRAWRSSSAAGALGRLLWRLGAAGFDWVIDLQGLLRSGLLTAATRAPLRAGFADAREGARTFYTHRIAVAPRHTVDRNLALARRLGIDARPGDMRLEVSVAGHNFAQALCQSSGVRAGEFLVCVPPTTWATKRWPVRHWRSLLRACTALAPAVVIGAASDRALCDRVAEGLGPGVVNLAGQTRVDEMVGLIAASAGVICSDSAAKFIAPAVGVDCVTLMGPTRAARTGPYLRGRAIVAKTPCRGCLKRRCSHITCMQWIDPDQVAKAAEAMLRRARAGR